MTDVRHLIDPEPVRAELKDAAVRFLFDDGQPERVAVERDRRIVGVIRTFNRDVCAAGELRPMKIRNHLA